MHRYDGYTRLGDEPLTVGRFAYASPGQDSLRFETRGSARLFVVGGTPFEDPILLWWNFVGRTPEEIKRALDEWASDDPRFGQVRGFEGERLDAPAWVPLSMPRRRE